jgi:O-antigen/teichoic acid export membrane protein
MKNITLSGIGTRFAIALFLVLITWNPIDFNYIDWARTNWSVHTPVVFLLGVVLVISWVVFLRATFRSLGPVGITLAVALAVGILWLMVDFGLVDLANSTALAWVLLVLLAGILAAGMSWSHLRRRWAGQADVDDLDDEG